MNLPIWIYLIGGTSILLNIILFYIIYNILRKLEKSEDYVVGYLEYLDKISKTIELSDERMKLVDSKGTFKSDDEIGFFFEEIKEIQQILNEFNIKNING